MHIFTIGHSTRTIQEFIDLLQAHTIRTLVDVRTIPRSLRNPQFGAGELAASLREVGIAYARIGSLGGLRKPGKDSPNLGWRNTSFRGYADHMGTPEFKAGLAELMAIAEKEPTAIMCAEAVPWRCHRSLIADALVARNHGVRHIYSRTKSPPHKPMPFLRIQADGELLYPEDGQARLL